MPRSNAPAPPAAPLSNGADRHQRCAGPGRGSAGPGQGRRGGAKKASEWMAGKGFYTSEQYWDCNRYRGNEAFEDQPEACRHANEARALAEVVRWRANRAQTVAEHARALAYETSVADTTRRGGTAHGWPASASGRSRATAGAGDRHAGRGPRGLRGAESGVAGPAGARRPVAGGRMPSTRTRRSHRTMAAAAGRARCSAGRSARRPVPPGPRHWD